MFVRMVALLHRLNLRFLRETDGSVLPMLGLALIPLMSAVGAGIDFSRASSVQTSVQAALDSAVLAGAKDGSAGWAGTAQDVFNANLVAKGSTVDRPAFTT